MQFIILHFTDEKTEAQRGSINLPEVTQLGKRQDQDSNLAMFEGHSLAAAPGAGWRDEARRGALERGSGAEGSAVVSRGRGGGLGAGGGGREQRGGRSLAGF